MSLGRPGRWTSPAEIMVVRPPLRPDSMKSMVRCRGVKSPNTGWQCESMRPGMTALPLASMMVSASASSPRPAAAIFPSAMTMLSASRSGRAMSPDTIRPMFLMSVFMLSFSSLSPSPCPLPLRGRGMLDGQVGAARGFVFDEAAHGPLPADLALLDDVGAVGQSRRELEILLGEENGQALSLQGGDLLTEGLDDDRRQPLGGLVEQQDTRIAHEGARHREHLLLAAGEAAPTTPRHLPELGKILEDARDTPPASPLGADEQVLHHREIAEDTSILGYPADAEPTDLVSGQPLDGLPVEADRAAGDLDETHDGLES